jgi:uncharacterized protein (TIGR00725 family)
VSSKSPKAVAIFGSSQTQTGSPGWNDAEKAGARFAGAGLGVVTGGYGGTMEAASKGASRAGGTVIGVTAPQLFKKRTEANPYVTEEIEAESLTDRLGVLTRLAHGALVLPGSIGTAAELIVAWNINHIVRRNGGERFPTVAIGEGWGGFWEFLTRDLGASGGDIHRADTVDEAVDWLLEQPEIR